MSILTLIFAAVSFVIGPTMTVKCNDYLKCEALVYPNTSTAPLILAVDGEYLNQWQTFSVPGGWGMRLWFDPPACIGSVARIRLLEGEDRSPIEPMPPSPVIASYDVAVYCSLLPLVSK